MQDWTDDEIAGVHYGEIEALTREVTGCEFALVSDHVKRVAEVGKRPREQDPVRLVHSDFAADYAEIVRGSYRDVRVAFRTYDTELVRAGKTFFTPHSAFRDPAVAAGNAARFSIELRVMCMFV